MTEAESNATPESPLYFETAVGYPTTFALVEYIMSRRVALATAVDRMAKIGVEIVKLKLQGCEIEGKYVDDEKPYVAPSGIDMDGLNQVKRIRVEMAQDFQDAIKFLAIQYELPDDKMFEKLIEEARTVRILHLRGAELICRWPNGDETVIELLTEK